MENLDFLDEELSKTSVFTDESKLSPEYVPRNLRYRMEELRLLVGIFKGLFHNQGGNKNAMIVGPVGTGKTSIAKKFGTWVNSKSQEKNKQIQYVHINCRRNRSSFSILLTLARELNSHVPNRGYSAQELLSLIIELLEVRKLSLIIVLDEVDFIQHSELSNLLYSLTRTTEEKTESLFNLGLILIARNSTLLNAVDEATRSTLSPALIDLEPYSKTELRQILKDRVDESFKHGAIPQDTIDFTADIVARKGDARYALELMWFGGKYADRDGSSTVYPDYIREARANLEPRFIKQVLDDLNTHHLLSCLGIAFKLKNAKTAYITTGIAEEGYRMACEQLGIEPRKHTQFWSYLKQLDHLDIIQSKMSTEGQRGTTQHLTLHDVTAEQLEKEVQTRLRDREIE